MATDEEAVFITEIPSGAHDVLITLAANGIDIDLELIDASQTVFDDVTCLAGSGCISGKGNSYRDYTNTRL